MNTDALVATATALMADNRGLLAMDESTPTCDKRLASVGIAPTPEMRRAYRELLVTTPGLGEAISGAILFDETLDQRSAAGVLFVDVLGAAGIKVGIKVDMGAKPLALYAGEQVSEGLDGLRERLAGYARRGAQFAKWRAVITLGDGRPSHACIAANAHALARYAALCQEAGIVPIVEPEVLMEGEHTLARCAEVSEQVLHAVFEQLYHQCVMAEGMLLKPNMVLPGLACARQDSVDAVADATIRTLLRAVPGAVAGIAFLSGGQSAELASARLNAMNVRGAGRLPWPLAFSYARALQQPALELWHGDAARVAIAQQALLHRARCNRAARAGQYSAAMESQHA